MRLSYISWNVYGLALPLVAAVLTIPALIDNIGQERFGLLALAWGLIGYAGSLDIGIGRALTQMVARMLGSGDVSAIPDALATAVRITFVTGLAGGVLIAAAAFLGAYNWVISASTPPSEILNAMLLLAIALPAQAMSATYKGMCEAHMRFKGINLIRAALGVINFAGPLLISLLTPRLHWLVVSLVASRLLALVAYRVLAHSVSEIAEKQARRPAYSSGLARSMFSFGAWVTVSSVISPILLQADRFLIAVSISAAAVATYVLPYEIVVQSLILVGAVSSVMFPALGSMIREKPDEWRAYFRKWCLKIAALMACVCLILALTLPILLPLWLRDNLDPKSILVGQILCLGVFANSIGAMFNALFHAAGRADFTAKLHVVELPFYILALMYLLNLYGIEGAAWAWVGRMAVDALVLAMAGARL